MDRNRFDDLTRTLGARSNRRSVVKSFGAAALGAAGVIGLRGAVGAAPAAKTTICHWDAVLATYQQLSVTAKDLKGHAKHGHDILAPDFTSPATCGTCTTTCPDPTNGTATCTNGGCGVSCDDGYEPDGSGGCQAASTPPDCADVGCPSSGECYNPGICSNGSCSAETPKDLGVLCSAGRTCDGAGTCTCYDVASNRGVDCQFQLGDNQCTTTQCINGLCYNDISELNYTSCNNPIGGGAAGTCCGGACWTGPCQ